VESNPTTCHRILLQCTNLLSDVEDNQLGDGGQCCRAGYCVPISRGPENGVSGRYSDIRARWAVICTVNSSGLTHLGAGIE
jgi:hypothetical protein